jgi:hypothetical protein
MAEAGSAGEDRGPGGFSPEDLARLAQWAAENSRSAPARDNTKIFLIVAVCVIGALYVQNLATKSPAPQPNPGPQPLPAVTLADAMAGIAWESFDAATVAALCQHYAALVEFDGKQSQPLIYNTAELGRRFNKMALYMIEGQSLAKKYPMFNEVLSAAVAQRLQPTNVGVEVTPQLRAEAVKMYQEIAEGVSRRL